MGRYEIEAEKEIESLQKWMLEARDDRDRCMEEIETLKAGREEAVKLVLDAGLSTGHADTCGDLMLEVMGEIESLRSMVAKDSESLRNRAIEIADLVTERDEWKRRAEEMHYWLQTGTCSEHKQYDNFWEEFLYNNAEAAKWFEEE